LLSTLEYCAQTFQEVAEDAVEFLADSYLTQSKLSEGSTKFIANIICDVMERYPKIQQTILRECVERFSDIQSTQILKVILWSMSEYAETTQSVIHSLDILKVQIGSLPFELEKKKEETSTSAVEEKKTQTRTRTVILADGTYGTEVISEANIKSNGLKCLFNLLEMDQTDETASFLRTNMLTSSFFASSVVITLLKLIYKLRGDAKYNLYASQVLMILIGFLKFYNAEEAKSDPELLCKLQIGIKFLTNPKIFLQKNFVWLDVF
jgi:hypothetical protein